MDRPTIPLLSTPNQSTQDVYRAWRERFILPLLFGMLIFGGIALFPAISASSSILVNGIFLGTYAIVALMAIFRFSYNIRISAFLFSVFMLGIGELLTHGILGDGLFFFLGLVIFATMLSSPRAGIVSIIVSIAAFVVMGWLMLTDRLETLNPLASPAILADWISASAALVMFGIVIIIGFQQLEREFSDAQKQVAESLSIVRDERNNLENRVQERTLQLRRINEVEQAVSAVLDEQELLPLAVKFIQNEFGFYHTAIYLSDATGQWLELKEAAGETGKVLKEKKHRIQISGKSITAQIVRSKTGQILTDTNQILRENPLFPYTRSLIIVPLIVGDTVLGVLEMHSSKDNEFLPQDLDAYQNMANGISIAIENSKLFQEAQQSIAEMRATQRQYLGTAWSNLSTERSLSYALGDKDTEDVSPLEVPLALRNQMIGQIQLASSAEWSSEQKNLIEAIAAQATLALENARLVEGSQFTAAQEKLANEIVSKIWASPNMDGILQTAVRELGRGLEASEVEIEISMEGKKDE